MPEHLSSYNQKLEKINEWFKSSKITKIATYPKSNNIDPNDVKIIYDLYYNNKEHEITKLSPVALRFYGIYFFFNHQIEKGLSYLTKSSNLGIISAFNDLGLYYDHIKFYTKAEKMYLKAANMGYELSPYNLGMFYNKQKKYSDMTKWFERSLKHINNITNCSLENIIGYYDDNNLIENIYNLFDKYGANINTKKFNKKSAIDKYLKLYTKFKNITAFNMVKNEECSICCTKTKLFPMQCFAHYYCRTCYSKMKKCPMGCIY